jgi:hypothetical protein
VPWKALKEHFQQHSMLENAKTHQHWVICKHIFCHFLLPPNTPTSLSFATVFAISPHQQVQSLIISKRDWFHAFSKKIDKDIHKNQPNSNELETYILLSTLAPFKNWDCQPSSHLHSREIVCSLIFLTNNYDENIMPKPKTLNPNISAPIYRKTFLKKVLESSRQALFKNMSEIPVRHLGVKLWRSTRRISIAIFLVTMGWIQFFGKRLLQLFTRAIKEIPWKFYNKCTKIAIFLKNAFCPFKANNSSLAQFEQLHGMVL